ncbi:ComEA family DNA-binding protein [Neobacillus sp. Marseille-QA0830]
MSTSPKGTIWRVRHSLWMLFTFTFIFNWIGFFIIGRKARHKKWSMYGALYTIPFILLCVFGERYSTNAWQWDLIGYSMIGGGIISIIHAFRIRKEYFYRLEAIEMRRPEEDRRLRGQIQAEYGMGSNQAPSQQPPVQPAMKRMNTEVPKPYPQQADSKASLQKAPASSLQKSSGPDWQKEPGAVSLQKGPSASEPVVVNSEPVPVPAPNLVDLNQATEFEIATLPGVGPIFAKRAIQERENLGGFQSLEDFAEILGLKPHIVERIRPLVTVSGQKDPRNKHYAGRMVDF